MKLIPLNKIKRHLKKIFYNKSVKIRKNDIYLVSFPKSGNTWMRFLLINYFFKQDSEKIVYSSLENYIPSIHKSTHADINKFKGYNGIRIIKSHFVKLKYPKVIYVLRDGRDAMVSYYYYQKDLRDFKGNFEDFYFSKQISNADFWDGHLRKALDYQRKFPDNIIFIRYEDLKNNIENTLTDVIKFLGHEIDLDRMRHSIQVSSFNILKDMQEDSGVMIENKNINFFRKGASGQWNDYFNEEMENHFLNRSKDLLLKFNYTS